MTDVARLQIKIDSSQAKQAEANLQGLERQSKRNEQSNSRLSQSSKILGQSIFTLKNLIGTLFVGSMIRAADEMTLLEGRMRLATKTTKEFEDAWSALNKQAASISGDLSAGVEIFQRISFNREEIKAGIDEMVQFTGTVQKLGVVAGASTSAMKAGLMQLGQSLSSDIVRAEEFNSIMENIPAVGNAIAKEFGITSGQLRRLVIEGKVASEDVFAAILNQTEEANAQFDKMPMTIGRATQQLWFQLKTLVSGFDETTNSSSILVAIIHGITEAVKTLNVLVRGIGFAFTTVAQTGAALLLDNINKIIDGINSIINGMNKIKPGNDIGAIERIGGGEAGENTFAIQSADLTKERYADLINEINVLFPAQEQLAVSTRKIGNDYKKLAESLSETDSEAEKAAKKISDVVEQLEFNIEQLKRSSIEQEIYNNLRKAGVDIDSEAGQKIEGLTRKYEEMSEQLNRQERLVEDVSDAFGTMFEDAIRGTGSFKDALGGLAGALQDILLQLLVIEPLKKSIAGSLGGGGGGIGSLFSAGLSMFSGGAGSSFSTAGMAGNIAASLPKFANGGSMVIGGNSGVDKNQLSLNGTPIASVSKGETLSVSPNGGNSGNVYNIDARGAELGVEQRIMQALKSLDRSIEPRALGAVTKATRRDPTFGRK